MDKLFGLFPVRVMAEAERLIVEALGEKIVVDNEDGKLVAYQYMGDVYVVEWEPRRQLTD